METNETTSSWEDRIKKHLINNDFRSRTCKIYNQKARIIGNDLNKLCPCGRLVRRHSFNGESLQNEKEKQNNPNWEPSNQFKKSHYSTSIPVTIFGRLKSSGCKFVRLDAQKEMNIVYDLLVDDCGGKDHKPALILSVYGGAKYFIMTEKLEKEIIRGIIDAATTADAWILTAGVNSGVSKLVGEGISHYRLLREYPNKVKCIGLTMWGTANESTRFELKHSTHLYPRDLLYRQIPDDVQDEKETIEKNHTHCILLHDGGFNEYLSDLHRNKLVTEACKDKNHACYAVTIIIEGGTGTLEVLEHDLAARRPVVLIQDSGRLADVLASLIEQTSHSKQNQESVPTDEDIKQAFHQFFPNPDELKIPSLTIRIRQILHKDNRHLLNVFSLDRDDDVAKTIFKAIFAMKNKRDELHNVNNQEAEGQNQEKQRRNDDYRLVNLALEWNYIDGVLPILQSRQDAMGKLGQDYNEEEIKCYKKLFKDSLEKNRPKFIEYILAAGFDPRVLIEIQNIEQREKILSKLYEDTHLQMNKSHATCIEKLFGKPAIKRVEKLDEKLNKFVGIFIGTIYSSGEDDFRKRVYIDMKTHICTCRGFNKIRGNSPANQDNQHLKDNNQDHQPLDPNNKNEPSYRKDELLRDLFLWSIFMDMPEMSKVILLHLQSRICAALIASAIFKRYSKASTIVDHKEKFQNQALEFETYAAQFIDKCYEYNERLACELLLRQIPLFGNITCMQVAISSESEKLVGTYCFYQTLTQVWYNKLSIDNHQTYAKLSQPFSILTFGLLAPLFITYRDEETERKGGELSSEGINCYIDKKESNVGQCKKYWSRVWYFHDSPMIKMTYHFISYIFFLLTFSYMMLYHLDSPDTFRIPHWTEIYVIITVSTMLCEEFRKLYHEYKTRMLERWGSTGSTLLTFSTNLFYILPYFLFYLGLGFRYRGYNDNILTTARILWAFDLELWYLKSLKFIVALKSVGPKLFMLKNMLKDLAAFVYMIFIAITAYGVVSRALILYKQVPFTLGGILKQIFYEPYWFIYGEVSDKSLLDEKIRNDTESVVAEATATHVLLAFHMLFINILILNLLIAVFTHTIDKVKENTEFYWRYQRYSFVREYFERPPLAYPPLIIVPHIVLVFLFLRRKFCPKSCHNEVGDVGYRSKSKGLIRIFKIIPVEKFEQNERWNEFEDAATHSYARSIVEKNKKKGVLTDDIHSKSTMGFMESDVIQPISHQKEMITSLNEEMLRMKSVLSDDITKINTQMGDHVKQLNQSLRWMMNAMARVKMNNPNEQPPTLTSLVGDNDVTELTQTTTSSGQ